jgi:hypothetical protein
MLIGYEIGVAVGFGVIVGVDVKRGVVVAVAVSVAVGTADVFARGMTSVAQADRKSVMFTSTNKTFFIGTPYPLRKRQEVVYYRLLFTSKDGKNEKIDPLPVFVAYQVS